MMVVTIKRRNRYYYPTFLVLSAEYYNYMLQTFKPCVGMYNNLMQDTFYESNWQTPKIYQCFVIEQCHHYSFIYL